MFSSGVNKVFLVGQVIEEPSLKNLYPQSNYTTFILLTKEDIAKNNQIIEHLEYHSVIIPDELKDKYSLIKKNRLIYIKGKIQTTAWTDDSNVRRYKTEIIASQVQLLFGVELPVLNGEVVY